MNSESQYESLRSGEHLPYDNVIGRAGGFGKFQYFALIVLVLSKVTGDMIINNLAYYEL